VQGKTFFAALAGFAFQPDMQQTANAITLSQFFFAGLAGFAFQRDM